MVVKLSVQLKAALIDAGRNHGSVCDIHRTEGLAAVGKGFLDADLKGLAVRSFTDAQHIAAQIDDAASDSVFQKKVFDAVGNVALCHSAQVNAHARAAEPDLVSA